MSKEREDQPSVSEFVKAYQAQQTKGSQAKAILVGMVIGYAVRRQS